MGDGVEPFLKAGIGALIGSVVGGVHGVFDGYFGRETGPGALHAFASYAPAVVSAYLTGSAQYGYYSKKERAIGSAIGGGTALAATGFCYAAGNVFGTILAGGLENLL